MVKNSMINRKMFNKYDEYVNVQNERLNENNDEDNNNDTNNSRYKQSKISLFCVKEILFPQNMNVYGCYSLQMQNRMPYANTSTQLMTV